MRWAQRLETLGRIWYHTHTHTDTDTHTHTDGHTDGHTPTHPHWRIPTWIHENTRWRKNIHKQTFPQRHIDCDYSDKRADERTGSYSERETCLVATMREKQRSITHTQSSSRQDNQFGPGQGTEDYVTWPSLPHLFLLGEGGGGGGDHRLGRLICSTHAQTARRCCRLNLRLHHFVCSVIPWPGHLRFPDAALLLALQREVEANIRKLILGLHLTQTS